jgi:hypothetical protein
MTNRYQSLIALVTGCLLVCSSQAQQTAATEAEPAKAVDNGTDPTKFSRLAEAKYEYLDLQGGFGSGTLRLSYTEPLGEKNDYSLRLRVPVTYVDVLGNDQHALGDVSIQLQHVFGLTKGHAFVAQGELIFDTADRQELGFGKNVFKGTLIYAKFLQGGGIFAPAFVQSKSISGNNARAKVNTTTLDFYYVPKLANPRNLVTFDPSLNFDWENDKRFAGLAVTMGRVTGPAFGGNGILFVKPSVFVGGDRPSSWGVEVGFKVLGF